MKFNKFFGRVVGDKWRLLAFESHVQSARAGGALTVQQLHLIHTRRQWVVASRTGALFAGDPIPAFIAHAAEDFIGVPARVIGGVEVRLESLESSDVAQGDAAPIPTARRQLVRKIDFRGRNQTQGA